MKLVTVAEMQAIEREANEQGWTYAQMMEKAGRGLAEIVQSFYGYEETRVALGLVGSGNNGGDTLIALESLAQDGWQTRAYLVRSRSGDDPLVQRVVQAGGQVKRVEDDENLQVLSGWVDESTVLVDGVFGTGIRLPLRGEAARVLESIRQRIERPPVVAVDCPSGVDLDSGQAADEAIPADVTVCMAAVKTGLLKFPAYRLAGEIEVVDIGLPEGLPSWRAVQREVVTAETVRAILPERRADSHKGSFGTVGVVAGSVNYSGAVLLCSRAAHRIGAGLVQVAIPAPLHAALAGHFPEATWVLLPSDMGVIAESAAAVLNKYLERVTVLLWGPGFGVEDPTAAFVRQLVSNVGGPKNRPARRAAMGFVQASVETGMDTAPARIPHMVIDADGLKLLARVPDWPTLLPENTVLTPHPGEMAVLTGNKVGEIQADRLETARRFARAWGHVVVLKGAMTIVAAPDGRSGLIPVASSALAHAGTGDVLAGMIAGLMAQGAPAYEAALASAWLHAQSGLLAAEHIGHEASVLASDLIEALPEVLSWVW